MKIDLGGHQIEVKLDGKGGGKLTSTLKDLEAAEQGDDDVIEYNIAIDGLEALVLAQACAGVNIQTQEYTNAVAVAVEAIQHEFIQ